MRHVWGSVKRLRLLERQSETALELETLSFKTNEPAHSVPAVSQKSLMLFEILAALFFSTVHAAALPSPAIEDPQNNIFASHNPSFCWKRTHGRGFGKLPDYRNKGTCANTLEKSWGLCYPSCGEFGQGRGPVCWGKCSEGSAFPHPCGGGCAKDAQACALNTISQVKETVEVAYNFGAVISVAAAAAGKQNPLLSAAARLVAWTW